MYSLMKQHAFWVLLVGCSLCLLGAGMIAGTLITASSNPPPQHPFAELPLFATATDTGATMSMATGPIDEEIEGIFFLDFITGELACAVLNSRTTKLGGIFKTNVIKDLGVDEAKKPAYLMCTGAANFVGFKVGAKQPANCVVYVADANTGRFAGYSLMWDRGFAARGAPQVGVLNLLIAENARAVKVEE